MESCNLADGFTQPLELCIGAKIKVTLELNNTIGPVRELGCDHHHPVGVYGRGHRECDRKDGKEVRVSTSSVKEDTGLKL